MKIKLTLIAPALLALSTLNSQLSTAFAQGTAFTYQGRLNAGGSPAGGLYDFRFRLDADPAGNTILTTVVTNAVGVTNGLFLATIDFGPGFYNGSNYWLEVDVKTNLAGSYTQLNPFQPLTPTPYAVFAITASNVSGAISAAQLSGMVPSANLTGTYGNVLTFNNAGNSFSGNGGGLTSVNALTLDGQGPNNFWQTTGNAGTTAGVNFVGTTDNQPLELHADGQRALRLEPNLASGAPNVIGGSPGNFVSSGVIGATIGGGATYDPHAARHEETNSITADFGTVSGGDGNTAGYYSTVSGGFQNSASGPSSGGATVGGGQDNNASGDFAMVGGGAQNNASGLGSTIGGGGYDGSTISGNAVQADAATIGGGLGNQIQTGGAYAFIGGGQQNTNLSATAVIGGGYQNIIQPGNAAVIGGGYQNLVGTNSYEATIAGGAQNVIETNAEQATIGGGNDNIIDPNSFDTTIGGGYANVANGNEATVGGGYENTNSGVGATVGGGAQNNASGLGSTIGGGGYDGSTISGNAVQADAATIGGGLGNQIQAGGAYAFIGGGNGNRATNSYATVPGGNQNTAGGEYSFAAGQQAHALHQGAFVWADAQNATFSSTASNQFLIRAGGGVGINVNNPGTASLAVQGGQTGGVGNNSFNFPVVLFQNTNTSVNNGPALRVVSGGGTNYYGALCVSANVVPGSPNGYIATFGNADAFVCMISSDGAIYTAGNVYANGVELTSDRSAKEHFIPVNPQTVLAKVASLPVAEWNYKSDSKEVQHLGPMAQDFQAAFHLNGADDKHISVVDEGGVALAAIQGLDEKVEAGSQKSEIRIQNLEAENTKLKQQNDSLAERLNKLEATVKQLTTQQ